MHLVGAIGQVHLCVPIYMVESRNMSFYQKGWDRDIKDGNRIRKLVRGNLITEEIYQLNCMLLDGNLPDVSVNQDKLAKDVQSNKLIL